jgi:hypothetical protein
LWQDLDWIAFEPEPASEAEGEGGATAVARGARRLELFLDRLVAKATTSSEYLLSTGYRGVDEAEERLRVRLLELLEDHSLEGTSAWAEVEALGARLGHEPSRRRRTSRPPHS